MPTTPIKGFPYPSASDDVDVPGDMAALALALDAAQFGSPGDDVQIVLAGQIFG